MFFHHKGKRSYQKDGGGYITLISVLIVGAVGTAITLSLLLLGVGASRTSFAIEQSRQAWGFANACAEEALQQIRDLSTFTGTGNLTFAQGTCTYTVLDQGGQNRTVTASGIAGTVIRKEKIVLDMVTPVIHIISWKEVADF